MPRLNRNKAGFDPSLPQPLSGRSSGTRTGFFAIAALAFSFFLSFDHSINHSFIHSFSTSSEEKETSLPPQRRLERGRSLQHIRRWQKSEAFSRHGLPVSIRAVCAVAVLVRVSRRVVSNDCERPQFDPTSINFDRTFAVLSPRNADYLSIYLTN